MNYIVLFVLLILVFAFLRVNNFISEDYYTTTSMPLCTTNSPDINNNIDLTIQYYNNTIVFYWHTHQAYDHFEIYEDTEKLVFDTEEKILADKIGFYEKPYIPKNITDENITSSKVKKYKIKAYKNGCYDESNTLESKQYIPQLKNVELEDYAVCKVDGSHKIMFADIEDITKEKQKYKKIENAGADEVKYYTSDLYNVDFSKHITDNELKKLNDPNVNRFKINFK